MDAAIPLVVLAILGLGAWWLLREIGRLMRRSMGRLMRRSELARQIIPISVIGGLSMAVLGGALGLALFGSGSSRILGMAAVAMFGGAPALGGFMHLVSRPMRPERANVVNLLAAALWSGVVGVLLLWYAADNSGDLLLALQGTVIAILTEGDAMLIDFGAAGATLLAFFMILISAMIAAAGLLDRPR